MLCGQRGPASVHGPSIHAKGDENETNEDDEKENDGRIDKTTPMLQGGRAWRPVPESAESHPKSGLRIVKCNTRRFGIEDKLQRMTFDLKPLPNEVCHVPRMSHCQLKV